MDDEELEAIRTRDAFAETGAMGVETSAFDAVMDRRALLALVDRLHIRIETLTMQRDEADRYRAGRLVRERDEWEANAQEARAGTTHRCPREGWGTMPCCGKTPFEVPQSDRMTVHDNLVTCEK